MITLKSFSLKTLFLVFTICVFVAGGVMGWLIGRYQGATDLADILENRAVLDGMQQEGDEFTLGSDQQYYIIRKNTTPLDSVNLYSPGGD